MYDGTMALELSPEQLTLVQRPAQGRLFLEGPAGTGKTTVGVAWMLRLLAQGIPGQAMLVLVPQRTLGMPYAEALHSVPSSAEVDIVTVGGLARRGVELFWPLVAEAARFAHPQRPPTFLTLEGAQHRMAHIVRPLLEQERYFDSITLEPHRIYSQILDNLNKAALVGFDPSEIKTRLQGASNGDREQARVFENLQDCVDRFRAYCLEHGVLDFSLQLEVFSRQLWPNASYRDHLDARYHHVIADNLEESTPLDCDVLRDWLPGRNSALLIYDEGAGYRSFLGADPQTAYALKARCDARETFSHSFVASRDVQTFERRLAQALERPGDAGAEGGDPACVLSFAYKRYHPEVLDWVADEVARLVGEGAVVPGEIVILAPFLSDALRFALSNRLEVCGISVHAHRPSRPLVEEPATRCLLTLASLAHPEWGLAPAPLDLTYALQQALDLDLVRAQLLVETLYRVAETGPTLGSFDQLNPAMQARITYGMGGRYEHLRTWLCDYPKRPPEPLDHALRRLFGEVLSQPGYGFHKNLDAAQAAANLVESVQKFRWVTEACPVEGETPLGKEYVQRVRDGVIAAQYVQSWTQQAADAVLLAPATTFLLGNRPVDYQVWLNVGSPGWWERISQPLTHPYVLSRRWKEGASWTDQDEVEANEERLYRLLTGLLRRCRKKVILGLSELDEQGMEQQGPLLSALQRVLQTFHVEEGADGL